MAERVISGGDRMEAALRDISRRLSGGASLKVGFLSGSTYPDGKPTAMIAAIQEFGAPSRNIPPRPFFRQAVAKHSGEWAGQITEQLKATNYDADLALARMGMVIKGEIQQSIRDLTEPPLKPATIRRKGFSKPLISTGHLLNSVDFVVEEKA